MKIKLCPLFFTLVLIAGVHPGQSQPALSLSPAGSKALLNWPAEATNYVLQSATNLVTPNWEAVKGALPGTNLPVAYDSPARFFRLSQITVVPVGMAEVASN